MRILLISTSARGHAIADALSRSRHKPEIVSVCPSKNPGIAALAVEQHNVNVLDFDSILAIAENSGVDFCIIGPEDPLAAGIVDRLLECGIPSVGPTGTHAQIESSKGFTRALLQRYAIDASPKFFVFEQDDPAAMRNFIDTELHGEFVIKYDGLLGGKGVKVSGEHLSSIDEGVAYASTCIQNCGKVVIEEKLVGVEFSLMSFVSGTSLLHMPAVQDHKRANNGDMGPNTGGMGTYTDADHGLPFLTKDDLQKAKAINEQVAEALLKECSGPYKGILYGGFMAVNDGIRVIEYNARFGDPEALNVLPLLQSDFVDLCLGIIQGQLSNELAVFDRKATVCKYITPDGYPEKKDRIGELVRFPLVPSNARLYYGDVSLDEKGLLRLGGSRTAGIVGIGNTIAEAEAIAQTLCKKTEGPIRFRSDIATAPLIEQRIETMRQLRSSPMP